MRKQHGKLQRPLCKNRRKTMKKKKTKRPDWFDKCENEIDELLKIKKDAQDRYLARPTDTTKRGYRDARRLCQQKIKKVRDNWCSKKFEELQAFINHGDSYNLYERTKNITGPVKTSLSIFENENAEIIYGLDDRLKALNTYFEPLCNQNEETDYDTTLGAKKSGHLSVLHLLNVFPDFLKGMYEQHYQLIFNFFDLVDRKLF